MPDLVELIKQKGRCDGHFGFVPADRHKGILYYKGVSELPDSDRMLADQVCEGDKPYVLLSFKQELLLFEHKKGGIPDPDNNNKRVGYQVYRYPLQNYPGLMESIRPQILPESVSETLQKDSFEKTETPSSDELVHEIKQLAEWVRENEQHKLSEQASFEKAKKQVLDELVCEVRQLSEWVRHNQQTQLPEKPPDKYQFSVSVASKGLWFIVAIITLLVGSFGVLVYKKVDNIERPVMSHSEKMAVIIFCHYNYPFSGQFWCAYLQQSR
ncbi:MAG: hypothetical protein VSS75_023170 [Candidatus Parabeggiatoa sp.]|nr:hypothetical protein [Candidatus Parabeggiatoa sp.]